MKRGLLTILGIGLQLMLLAQGCSDAGFCSINGVNPSSHLDSNKTLNNHLQIGLTSGIAQFGVFISSPYIQYDVQATEKLTLSAKANYTIINGALTLNNGFSDVFLSINYNIYKSFSFISGVKVPFNNADAIYQGYELPMSYQTTLGTSDYLIGISYSKKNMLFSIGSQIPLIQNRNSFFVENFLSYGINENYLSTNKYIRKPDIIARFNYVATLKNENFKLTLGVLPIYHLTNDEYTGLDGVRKSIPKSKGLTLNLNSVIRYQISETNHLDLTVGLPVLSRENRPDGLTQLALNIQYGINF